MPFFSSRVALLLIEAALLASHNGAESGLFNFCSEANGCQNVTDFDTIVGHLNTANSSQVTVTFLRSFVLNKALLLDYLETTSITFVGVSSEIVVTCLQDENLRANRGFYFKGIGNISLANLTIRKCSFVKRLHINSKFEYNFRSAIYFEDCLSIRLQNVVVAQSAGSGVTFLNNRGKLEVIESRFTGNELDSRYREMFAGGSGVFLSLNNTHNSSTLFHDCEFSYNNASEYGIGRGGGMRVLVTNLSSGNKILITSSSFVRNRGGWGGGLYLFYEGNPEGNIMSVKDTNIENNDSYERSGGGADLGFILKYDDDIKKYEENYIHFERCNFTNNSAVFYGGGVSIFATRLAQTDPRTHFMEFTNCKWSDNSALAGSAVDIAPAVSEYTVHGVFPRPRFTDCTFQSNEIKTKHISNAENLNVSLSGLGTVLITGYRVLFKGTTIFSDNLGCGLYINSGTVELLENSATKFIANEGYNGGALTLGTFSMILVHDNSYLEFVNNTASLSGGAIYSLSNDPHDELSPTSCFIQHFNTDEAERGPFGINFHFEGNKALSSNGNDVFLSSVKQCGCTSHSGNKMETFLCIGNITVAAEFDIATKVRHFVVTKQTGQTLLSSIIPGNRYYEIPIETFDQYNVSRLTVYEVIHDDMDEEIKPNSSFVAQNQLQFVGELNASGVLKLESDMTILSFNIKSANSCPPGYGLSDSECQCEAERIFGLSHCENNEAYIIQGFWMGRCLDGVSICTSHCPLGFCEYFKGNDRRSEGGIHKLPSDLMQLELFICGPTRKGILCGSCADNYTAFYHSYQYSCGGKKLCKYGIPLYVVSELLPLTIMFFAIIIFDVKFTAGCVNGFIFFAQVLDSISIDANGAITFPATLDTLTSIHRFVYRNLNFDFFSIEELSFCLWESATTLDAMVMKYVTILYAIGLLVLLIVVMNTWKCKKLFSCWRPRTIQSSAKNGLTAFIVICYSQCARVSFQILSPGYLYGFNYTIQGKVAFRRGDFELFKPEHLTYAIPALLVLLIMSLIPFFLILYPLIYKLLALCKLSESKLASIISRFIPIPLLDSFQSSFKDDFRFFAGLYFLYRLFALAAYAYSPTLIIFYTWVELKLIVILALHSAVQPYKVKWHNFIDSLIFANLAIINGITLFNYFKVVNASSKGDRKEKSITMFSAIQVILIYIPLFCIATYFLILIFRKCKTRFVASSPRDVSEIDLPPLREDGCVDPSKTEITLKKALLSEYTYGM